MNPRRTSSVSPFTLTLALVLGMAVAHADDRPAEAPSIPHLVGGLQAAQAQGSNLQATRDEAAQANARLERERALYVQQVTDRLVPTAAAIVADDARLAVAITEHNTRIQPHIASCGGAVSTADRARCEGEAVHWNRAKAGLDDERAQIKARAAAYEKQAKPYRVRLAQIEEQQQANDATRTRAETALEETRARIAELQAQLVARCADATGGLAQLCQLHDGIITWDGARSNFPSLGPDRRGTAVAPNE